MSDDGVWVHLYAKGQARLTSPSGQPIKLDVETSYPWDGEINIGVQSEGEWSLFLRLPGWCEAGATLEVNGNCESKVLLPASYIELTREWKNGDIVRLHLPMLPRRIECHPFVAENKECVAIARGPLLYCLEAADHPGVDLHEVTLPPGAQLVAEYSGDVLQGVTTLTVDGFFTTTDADWKGRLYRTVKSNHCNPDVSSLPTVTPLTFIPYYAWANRDAGQMRVWVRESVS